MQKPTAIALALLCLLMLSFLALYQLRTNTTSTSTTNTLTLYCAASFQPAIEEVVRKFEATSNIQIRVIYNGSGALLSQIQASGGDFYLPANDQYTESAKELDLIYSSLPLTKMRPVIVVAKDNQTVHSLTDLTKSNIKISYPDESSAIGKWMTSYLKQQGILSSIKPNVIVTKPTVNAVLNDVAIGAADATFAWNSVVTHFPDLRVVPDKSLESHVLPSSLSLLKSSNHKNLVLEFLEFMKSAEAQEILIQNNFSTH